MQVALGICLAAVFGVAQGQPPDRGANQLASFNYVMNGLKASRDQLHSGVYRAHGTMRDLDKTWGPLNGDVELFHAFDFRGGNVRFDRTEPFRRGLRGAKMNKLLDRGQPNKPAPRGPKKRNGADSWEPSVKKIQFVHTPQGEIIHRGGPTVAVLPTDPSIAMEVKAFDIRCLGLAYLLDLEQASSFDEMYRSWLDDKPQSVTQEADGVWRVRWEDEMNQTTIWVKESQGFTPIRLEGRFKSGKGAKSRWSDPKTTSEVTWQQLSGVWVPKTFRIENTIIPNRTLSYDLSFEWESVNEPVAESLFTPQGLGIKRKAVVIDQTLGTPIITHQLNYPIQLLEEEEDSAPRPRKRTVFLIYLGSALAVGFLALLVRRLWKRFRHRSSSSPSS